MYPDLRLEHTETFSSREVTLPLHPKMDPADVERVATGLARALAN